MTAWFASRWLVGVEADVSFPSFSAHTIGGSATFGTAATGLASYAEQAEFFGTLRGRVGYAPGNWLFYATGGFAWSYDQFTRTQLAGVPVGGTATPGTVENLFMVPRVGGAVGAGVEVALTPSWTARLEYLFTDYGTRSVSFPAGAQRFDSDLTLQTLRVGLDYRLGNDITADTFTKAPDALELDRFALHGQTTFVEQYVPPFHAPYHGQNSLDANQGREGWGAMFFAGVKLWDGAELWIDPEIDQGFGPSNSVGVAGYPGGAAYKVGASVAYARIQRAFVRQTIDLGGDTEKVAADQNQFEGSNTNRPAGAHRRQVRADRHVRSEQIRDQSPPGFHELGADRYRHRSITPATPGAILTAQPPNGTRATGPCAAACSICRSFPTVPISMRVSGNSNGSAKSNAAGSCGRIRAKSRSPVF